MSSQELKKVATGSGARRTDSFPAMLESYKDQIAKALPAHLKPDTMLRIALTAFRMNPKLNECEPASVFAAVVQASQLGLRPNLLGECFLIPYAGKCQLQIGYQGLLELVRRSGLVDQISVNLVYGRDVFDVSLGTTPGIVHKPFLDGDRGAVRLGYAVANIRGGGVHVEIMTVEQINRIRDRSQNVISAKKYGKTTPWDTDWDEMARKTLARRICKWLPKSPELATAMQLSDAADRGVQDLTVDDAIAGTFAPVPVPEPEPEPESDAPKPAPVSEPAVAPSAPPDSDTTSKESYITALRGANTPKALVDVWSDIVSQHKIMKQDIPLDIEAVYHEMRESLRSGKA